jgi:hypothetical protein
MSSINAIISNTKAALWYIVLAVLGGLMVLNLLAAILYELFKNENRKPVDVTMKPSAPFSLGAAAERMCVTSKFTPIPTSKKI